MDDCNKGKIILFRDNIVHQSVNFNYKMSAIVVSYNKWISLLVLINYLWHCSACLFIYKFVSLSIFLFIYVSVNAINTMHFTRVHTFFVRIKSMKILRLKVK